MAASALPPSGQFQPNAVTLRTTDGTLTYDLAMRDSHTMEIDPEFHSLDEATVGARILGIMSKLGAPKVVRAPIYMMLRKKQFPRFVTAANSYAAGAATITISATDVGKFKSGYHLLNTLTREEMRVEGTPAAALPVKRGVGEVVDQASISTDDELLILGYRSAAKDAKFLDFIRLGDVIYNYVGEIQTAYAVDQYELDSGHVAGHDPLAVLRADKLQETRLNLEWQILMGQRGKTIRNDGLTVYAPGGIDNFCTENETDFAGTFGEDAFVAALRGIKRHGPSDRWGFASPLFMQKLNLALGKVNDRLAGDEVPTILGLDISTYRYAGLRVHFVEQPLLDDASSTHANSLKGHCFLVDPDDMDLVTMRGRLMGFFKWNMNVETPGSRSKEDQLIVNWGLRMRRPEHYARMFNVGS